MTYINESFDLANAETKVIPMDRWGYPAYTVQLDSGTSIVIEGTLQRINRGETALWNELIGNSLTSPDTQIPLTGVLPGPAYVIQSPVEAIRITATGNCTGRVMQTGAQ